MLSLLLRSDSTTPQPLKKDDLLDSSPRLEWDIEPHCIGRELLVLTKGYNCCLAGILVSGVLLLLTTQVLPL